MLFDPYPTWLNIACYIVDHVGAYSKNWILAELIHSNTRTISKFGGIYLCD